MFLCPREGHIFCLTTRLFLYLATTFVIDDLSISGRCLPFLSVNTSMISFALLKQETHLFLEHRNTKENIESDAPSLSFLCHTLILGWWWLKTKGGSHLKKGNKWKLHGGEMKVSKSLGEWLKREIWKIWNQELRGKTYFSKLKYIKSRKKWLVFKIKVKKKIKSQFF